MNFFILWLTGKILRENPSLKRIFVAATFGAVYLILASSIQFSWLVNSFTMILVFIGMVFIAVYNSGNYIFCARYTGVMILVAFASGGAILGLGHNQTLIEHMPIVNINMLIFGAVLITLLFYYLHSYLKQNILKKDFLMPLVISIEGREVEIIGLVDTGNQLVEPLTGHPVIVVESSALIELLPEKIQEVLQQGDVRLDNLIEIFSDDRWNKRLRVIPFSSVGNASGMMMGVRPDKVILYCQGKKISEKDTIIGLCQKNLCPTNSYRALVNPQLMC